MGQDLASANEATSRGQRCAPRHPAHEPLLHTLKRQRPTRACGVGLLPHFSSARVEARIDAYLNM